MSIIIDMIVKYPSYFFLNVLNSNNKYLILSYGLIIDVLLNKSFIIITLIMLVIYFLFRKIKNYYLKNVCYYVMFYLLYHLIMNYKFEYFMISFIMQLIYIFFSKQHIVKW